MTEQEKSLYINKSLFNLFCIKYANKIQEKIDQIDIEPIQETEYCQNIGKKEGLKKAFSIFKELKDEI